MAGPPAVSVCGGMLGGPGPEGSGAEALGGWGLDGRGEGEVRGPECSSAGDLESWKVGEQDGGRVRELSSSAAGDQVGQTCREVCRK